MRTAAVDQLRIVGGVECLQSAHPEVGTGHQSDSPPHESDGSGAIGFFRPASYAGLYVGVVEHGIGQCVVVGHFEFVGLAGEYPASVGIHHECYHGGVFQAGEGG